MISIVAGLTVPVIVYVLFKSFARPSLSMIRGPKSPSFIVGNLLELFQRPVGEADFAWQSQYGNVVRFKSVLGEDRLLIMDPKALQKILNTSGYTYSKVPHLRVISQFLNGKGIVWADGEDHKRQRSIMLPGFGAAEVKEFSPIFKDCAESMSMKWIETIGTGNDHSAVIDVLPWLLRGTLDAIGQAAFDVQFCAVQTDSHPLVKNYKNYLGDIFGLPSETQTFMLAASKYIPKPIFRWMIENGSSPRLARAREAKVMATSIAQGLLKEKADALLQGMDNRDIFTLLVKANMDASAKKKMSEEELLGQIRILLVAGHETTAVTVSWMLLELARNPGIQSRLRDEIRKMEAAIHARSDPRLTSTDLETMPYLNAVIKEGLRFHPAGPHAMRVACHDDIIPLSKPLLTTSGDMVHEILVPKGTEVLISIAAYNRDKDVWGEDAHTFKPDRWLDGTMDSRNVPSIGVYANLLTFFSGNRGCLGWRYACGPISLDQDESITYGHYDSLAEIQSLLWTLVDKFEFTMSDEAQRILRQPALIMVPMVDGELERGAQMPLAVSLAPQDGDI